MNVLHWCKFNEMKASVGNAELDNQSTLGTLDKKLSNSQ
jgi:hypothetical protein